MENDDSTRHVVAALLRNCCYEVVEASNGLQAWKFLEDMTNRIDLVLTEVVMPYFSGIALLCKIMSHQTRKTIPVIMMSSHDSMGLVFKCLSKGAVDFLVKPIRKNELKTLWQHLWRRCHSSSGSGSVSGTQTQKSVKSKGAEMSYNNSGSDDEENNSSPGLNFGDGSDHGSGTQSSWTKQAVEDQVESPRMVSQFNEVPECPDSTCAQVIIPNAKPSGSKLLSMTAPKECRERKEPPENIELEKALDTTLLKISDLQSNFSAHIPTELTSVNQFSAPKLESSQYSEQIDNRIRELFAEEKKESAVSAVANKFSKKPDVIDKAMDVNKDFPPTEQGLKRLRGVQDVGKAVQDERNVLRRSESSAFSRYNAVFHNKVPIMDEQHPTLHKNDLEEKSGLRPNFQSHSGSNAFIHCSNEASVYVDIISTSNNRLTKTIVSKNNSAKRSTNNYMSSSAFRDTENNRVSSTEQLLLEDTSVATAVKTVIPQVCSTQEHQVQPAHHQQLTSKHENFLIKKMEEPIPHCGSSTALDGHLDGNAGNYSANGSASGSNYGSSSGAIAGVVNTENNNGTGGKSGRGDACGNGNGNGTGTGSGSGSGNSSGSRSGSKVDDSKLAQRQAALTKFRQKRKARCYRRKVRYLSRKRLAEQRPRVRGQFVCQAPAGIPSKDTDS